MNRHARVIAIGGGAFAVRDLGALEAAVAQPQASFGGADLYDPLAERTGALGLSLILNHPFVDGNKRVGHSALEVFWVLNGSELVAAVDESERVIIDVAAGTIARDAFVTWIASHLSPTSARKGIRCAREQHHKTLHLSRGLRNCAGSAGASCLARPQVSVGVMRHEVPRGSPPRTEDARSAGSPHDDMLSQDARGLYWPQMPSCRA